MEHEAYVEMAASEEAHWWFRGRRQVLNAVIGRLDLPAGARILELGSGTGGNFAMLSRFGRLTAVEMNDMARQLSMIKSPRGVEIKSGWLPYGLPPLAHKFDLVCLFDVLEHVEDDTATLLAVRECVAPGGVVVITVPAFARLWGPHDQMMHHKRRYERAGLQAKLIDAGFAVTKLSYSNMFLFPAAVAARLLDRVLRRRKAGGAGTMPEPLNGLFAAIFGAERFLLGWTNLPVGLSLLAVARLDNDGSAKAG